MEKRVESGIEYELVRRKGMRNIRLTVLPPDGLVRVSAPLNAPNVQISDFVRQKASWIQARQRQIAASPRLRPREFVSGEQFLLWGRTVTLKVTYGASRCSVKLQGDVVQLNAPDGCPPEKREAAFDRFLRRELAAQLEQQIPRFETLTGLAGTSYSIRAMNTRWGSCTFATGAIRLNLKLVHYPVECLQMIIVHELGHLRHHDHGAGFKRYMDTYFPRWRAVNKLLR